MNIKEIQLGDEVTARPLKSSLTTEISGTISTIMLDGRIFIEDANMKHIQVVPESISHIRRVAT